MKNKIAFVLCLFSLQFFCQVNVLGVDTLYKSGPVNKRINLVILGDGYTSAEMPQFITDANSSWTYLLNESPFDRYKNYFNVFAIKCASPQSGITHDGTATDVTEPASPVMTVTNNFNTRFDNYGVHRNIYSMNPTPLYSVIANYFPNYGQIVVLGNSPEYGGAGGAYAVSSTHPNSNEIVAHEIGHSFAGLADEYWAGPQFAAEKPNLTANSNPGTIKWAPWLGLNSIGINAHGANPPENGWFRPHQNCKMRYLNVPFCSVCKEAIIEKIHSLVNPIDDYTPGNGNNINITNSQWFKTKLVKPNPNTLKTTWELNGSLIATNVDSLLITNMMLGPGNSSLLFRANDTTVFSKSVYHPAQHNFSLLWSIIYSPTGIKEIKAEMEFDIFPNPAADLINLKYTLMGESDVAISIIDAEGRMVVNNKSQKENKGDYKKEFNIKDLKSGIYFLSIKINEKVINNKFIISK